MNDWKAFYRLKEKGKWREDVLKILLIEDRMSEVLRKLHRLQKDLNL